MRRIKKKDSHGMRILATMLAVMTAAGMAQAQTPVDDVTYDGDNIATITVGGFTVDASDLTSGTSDDPPMPAN